MHTQVSHRETQARGGRQKRQAGIEILKAPLFLSEMGRPGTEMYSGILRIT